MHKESETWQNCDSKPPGAGLMMCGSIPGYSRDKYEPSTAPPGHQHPARTQHRHHPDHLLIFPLRRIEKSGAGVPEGQNQGLVLALQKMKSVGRITIPGTFGE